MDLEEQQEEEGANIDLDAHKTKCAVIKTSTRATYFLPVIGLVDHTELKPGDLVGVNKDSYLVLEKLPPEYDSRVKAMEVDERPTETYTDIGGCDTQIKELIEAIVSYEHSNKNKTLDIRCKVSKKGKKFMILKNYDVSSIHVQRLFVMMGQKFLHI